MTFRFTAADFERYVKVSEHGGRHIWHDLQDRLQEEFGVPFSNAPYVARGDRLRTMWFAPTGTPRARWDHQAQFHLARSIERKTLSFGLTIECATASFVKEHGYDQDRDGPRLVARLKDDPDFVAQVDSVASRPGWQLWASEERKDQQPDSPTNGAELLDVVRGFSGQHYWSVGIERVLTADEAIAAGDGIVDQVMDAYRTVRPLWEAVIPDAVRTFLREGQAAESATADTPGNPGSTRHISLHDYFASCNLHFSPLTLATYFTALQTKGFVILSGLSGTGKTKLAQRFADLLRSGGDMADNYLFLSVRPDWRDGRPLLGYYNPLMEQYETSELLRFILDARTEQTAPRLARMRDWLATRYTSDDVQNWLSQYKRVFNRLKGLPADQMTAQDLHLLWQERSNGIASIGRAMTMKATDDQLRAATKIVQDQNRSRGERIVEAIQFLREIPDNATPWARTLRALAAYDSVSTIADRHILRDLLGMLGYERAFHLERFVDSGDTAGIDEAFAYLKAQAERYAPSTDPLLCALTPWLMWEYLSGKMEPVADLTLALTPFFVLLDEMNISRVEYYFSDFLSVLEGGRDEDGFTRETIKLHGFPASARDKNGDPKPRDSDGRYVPSELRLPPNLYFVGTVNVDETTHAFSPKVLDRAFTIEITDVDFEGYPADTAVPVTEEQADRLRQKLLAPFARQGQFGIVNKDEIRSFVAAHRAYRTQLHALKATLQPFDLHFAYRIFDEIIAFCANAQANQFWTDLGGLDTAFDCAVLMKVLPKFHGPRSRLEQPLRSVLAWTLNPTDPEGMRQEIDEWTRDAGACLSLRRELDRHLLGGEATRFRYANTARKVVCMLQSLHALGFASFA